MEYVKGAAFIKTMGTTATLRCITASANCIYGLITCMVVHVEAPDIMLLIKESDLERKTRLLETILHDIDIKSHYTDSLALCITDLNSCLEDIKCLLGIVYTRSYYNKSLWLLKGFRKYTYTDIYTSLKVDIMNLDERRQSLFDVLQINHHLIVGIPPTNLPEVLYEGHIVLDLPKK